MSLGARGNKSKFKPAFYHLDVTNGMEEPPSSNANVEEISEWLLAHPAFGVTQKEVAKAVGEAAANHRRENVRELLARAIKVRAKIIKQQEVEAKKKGTDWKGVR